MTKKPFNELTKAGQTRRLNKYEAERKARGTEEVLARMVWDAPRIKEISGGNKLAILRLAIYDKESGETAFKNFNAFIAKDKTIEAKGDKSLEAFYASIEKGELLSVEYKVNGNFNNVWNIMSRKEADERRRQEMADAQASEPEVKSEVKAETASEQLNFADDELEA